jgi:hypothetical protein
MSALAERVRGLDGPAFLDARSAPWIGNEPAFPENLTGPTDLARALRTSNDPWYDNDDPVLREARDVLEAGATFEALEVLDRQILDEMSAALGEARTLPPADPAYAVTDVLSEP